MTWARYAPTLRLLRERSGLTQHSLAALVGRTHFAICRYEGGQKPSLATLFDILNACGATPAELFKDPT